MFALARHLLKSQMFRYLLAGGSAFVTEYVLFILFFVVLGAQIYISNSFSFCGGLVVSFSLNRTWAFKKSNFRMRGHHQASAYGVLALFNLLLINFIIGFLRHFHVAPVVAKLGAMLCIVAWNFFAFRLFIFAGSPESEKLSD